MANKAYTYYLVNIFTENYEKMGHFTTYNCTVNEWERVESLMENNNVASVHKFTVSKYTGVQTIELLLNGQWINQGRLQFTMPEHSSMA